MTDKYNRGRNNVSTDDLFVVFQPAQRLFWWRNKNIFEYEQLLKAHF